MRSPEQVIADVLSGAFPLPVAPVVVEALRKEGYLIVRGTQPDETGRLYYATGEFAGKANL